MIPGLGRSLAALGWLSGSVWRPEIGDPNRGGWVVTVAYITAGCLCCIYALRRGRWDTAERPRTHRAVWFGLAATMVLLGFNKQLDLQTLMTDLGRALAWRQGWIGYRRAVQLVFVVCLGAACMVLLTRAIRAMRSAWSELWLAMTGIAILLVFILVRAASFHHVVSALGLPSPSRRARHLTELFGAGCVAAGAALNLWRAWRRRVASTDP